VREMNRPGLTLYNGQVYIAFASHGDNGPYHGWVLRYDVPDTTDPAGRVNLTAALNTTPNGGLGGIWQAGGTLVFDPQGALYFETGNGSFTEASTNFNAQGLPIDANYGDSFIKVIEDPASTAANPNPNGWGMKVADFFTPFNEPSLDAADTDLGSGGPVVLPDSLGSAVHPHLLVGAGKEGKIYLIDRENMGKFDPATDHVVQEVGSAIKGSLDVPALFNNKIYYVPGYGGPGKTFAISNGAINPTATSTTALTYGFPGSSPSITANGTANAIVWTIDRQTNQLLAYNANSFAQLLWTSGQAANSRDQLGSVVKFTVPTPVDGKVFVGTSNALVSYGPPVPPTTIPADPVNLTAAARFATQIDLAWEDVATNEALYHIERSLDGTTGWTEIGTAGVNATSFIDSTVQPVTHYFYRVYATNDLGNSGFSNVADATTATAPPLGAGDGLLGQYYDNQDFTNLKVTRVDPTVNFNWDQGSPDPLIDVNTFSVRWTGQVQAQYTDAYTFYTQSDDGVRLYVNNQLIIDNFTDHSSTENSGVINLVAGRNYPIKMEFYENGGGAQAELRWSSTATPKAVIPKTQLFSGSVPNAPTKLTATPASATQVDLAWNDTSNNESGFKIERKEGAGGAWAQVAQVGPNETTYMDTALNAAATYVYRVRAANFGGDSPYSNEAQVTLPTPPTTPSNARASEITTHSLHLTWQDNSDNEDSWRLYRKRTDSDTFIFIADLPKNTTSYDDSGLTAGTVYDYHIQAANIAGYSDFTGLKVQTITNPPSNLAAAAGDGRVTLTWTAPEGAASYDVYRSTTADDLGAPIQTGVTDTTVVDTTAVNGTTYYYRVTATDDGGVSEVSNVASATPAASAVATIDDFLVSGDAWDPSFLEFLRSQDSGDGGFDVPSNTPAGVTPVPWSNVNKITLVFDRDVAVDQNSLVVHGVNQADYSMTGFAFDGTRHAATWTLGRATPNDRLTVTLAGNAEHEAFAAPLNVLAGDADRNGAVNALDLGNVKARLNRSTTNVGTGANGYSPFADVNGDGKINALDLAIVKQRLNNRLPAAGPAAVASVVSSSGPAAASITRDLFGSTEILA